MAGDFSGRLSRHLHGMERIHVQRRTGSVRLHASLIRWLVSGSLWTQLNYESISLHWTFSLLFYAVFLMWSIIVSKSKKIPFPPPSPKFPHFKQSNYYFACSNTLNLQTFLTISMTSEIESSKPYCFTPLYENAQK